MTVTSQGVRDVSHLIRLLVLDSRQRSGWVLQPKSSAIQYSKVYVYTVSKEVNIANLISINENVFPVCQYNLY